MQKGVQALTDGGWEHGYRWGTLLLFAGMIVTGLLDLLVHFVSKYAGINEEMDANRVPEVGGCKSSETRVSADKPSTDVVANMEAGNMSADEQDNSPSITHEHLDNVRCDFFCSVAASSPVLHLN